jgi:hypothetical protein
MQGHRLINMDEYNKTKYENSRILSNEMRQYLKCKVSEMGTETIQVGVRDSHESRRECKWDTNFGPI